MKIQWTDKKHTSRGSTFLAPIRIHATRDNDRSYDDGATRVTGIQSLLEQMYQIIREKSLLKNRLCGGHEPIFRDTMTGRLRSILSVR
jgi:hypothetical protein